ncbi:MAG: lytic transglycosylase domain-containing protein [Bryobacteraceae bacterium]
MRLCLISTALALAAATPLAAANAGERPSRLTLVVRADPRTGRLVRAPVVNPRPVQATAVQPRVVEPRRPAAVLGLEDYIEEVAARYNLDPVLVQAVIEVESGYDPAAISPKGAVGLMQLMPQTARRMGVRDSFNPWENIEGGVRYLKYLLALFNGDKRRALAAYNAGEGAVFRYGDIPPYPETLAYVYRVGKKLGEQRRAAGQQQAKGAAAPAAPRIVEYVDAQGRWCIQTKPSP